MARKVDLETVPQINGQSLLEMDIGEVADKPWRLPGEWACEGVCVGGWREIYLIRLVWNSLSIQFQ